VKYLVVPTGRFHSDPPNKKCGVLKQTKIVLSWIYGNDNLTDPIAWGREALKSEGIYRKPCLHCFPACKEKKP